MKNNYSLKKDSVSNPSIDNLGQSTSALNAIAFNITFIESLQSKIMPNDIVLLAPS